MADATSHGTADEGVFRLMYRSRDRIPSEQRRVELGHLFTEARSNNKKRDITGALLLSNEWFVQVLEGEESAVLSLYSRIENDPRHDSVSLIESGPVGQRVFARWAMAKVAAEDKPDIPLIAHVEGIHRAAGRPTTPEQDEVLDVMREMARGAPQAGSSPSR